MKALFIAFSAVFPVLILTASPISRAAETDRSNNDVADFCADPYATICGPGEEEKAEREQRLKALRQALYNQALAEVAPMQWKLSPVDALAVGRRFSQLVDERISSVERESVLANIEAVKRLLVRAIEDQRARGTLTSEQAEAFSRRIESVKVITQTMMLEKYSNDRDRPWLSIYMLGYHMTCGFDGMAENAYATIDGDAPAIVLCPGWLLRAQQDGDSKASAFDNILQVMAHELGHHIDARSGENLPIYARFNGCLAERFGGRLKYAETTFDHWLSDVAPEGRVTRAYRVLKHRGEITADFWAAQTVRQHLATLATRAERLEVVRQAWAGLCGTADEGTHPDARFRIEVLLASDPELAPLLGCAPTIGCTLAGRR